MRRTPPERRLLACRRPPYLCVWSCLSHCLYHLTHALFRESFLSDRTCTEGLKPYPAYRLAKRGHVHTIQLHLEARLCLIHGRRMGNVLRMAFTQNRVRSCTGTSLSLTMRLLSHGLPLPLRLS